MHEKRQINDLEKDCDEITYDNGDKYCGQCVDFKPQGMGKYTYANGHTIEGMCSGDNTVFNGECVIHYIDGNEYRGECKNNIPCGKGKLIYKSHSKFISYEGIFHSPTEHPYGKYTLLNGNVYVGFYTIDNGFYGACTYFNYVDMYAYTGIVNEQMRKQKRGITYDLIDEELFNYSIDFKARKERFRQLYMQKKYIKTMGIYEDGRFMRAIEECSSDTDDTEIIDT